MCVSCSVSHGYPLVFSSLKFDYFLYKILHSRHLQDYIHGPIPTLCFTGKQQKSIMVTSRRGKAASEGEYVLIIARKFEC